MIKPEELKNSFTKFTTEIIYTSKKIDIPDTCYMQITELTKNINAPKDKILEELCFIILAIYSNTNPHNNNLIDSYTIEKIDIILHQDPEIFAEEEIYRCWSCLRLV